MNTTSLVAFQTKDSENTRTPMSTLPSCLNFMLVFDCIKTYILSVDMPSCLNFMPVLIALRHIF